MSLTVVQEIWKTIKPSIEVGDVAEAAELLVNYLVDNDFDTQEMKSVFKHDPEVQKALAFFVEKPEDVDLFEEDEDLFEEEEDGYYNDEYDEY